VLSITPAKYVGLRRQNYRVPGKYCIF